MPHKTNKVDKQRVAGNSPEHHHMALAAAKLSSQEKTQKEISDFLHRSQADVSRLLSFAKTKGWYSDRPTIDMKKIPKDDWHMMEQKYFVDYDLNATFRHWAPAGMKVNVRVFPSSDDEFCNLAAPHLMHLIGACQTFGVMYGSMVNQLQKALKRRQHHYIKAPEADFITAPLCGDPTHTINKGSSALTASQLAEEYQKIVKGDSKLGELTLAGVPAYIPIAFSRPIGKNKPGPLKSFIYSIPGYQHIFGTHGNGPKSDSTGNPGLIHKFDGLITGAGIIPLEATTLEQVHATFIKERLMQEPDLSVEKMSRLIHGDIGGVLIPKKGLTKADQKKVKELNEGWVGMTQKNLSDIAERANKEEKPGVILVVSDTERAEMIKVLTSLGLINNLIINDAVAGVLKLMGDIDLQ